VSPSRAGPAREKRLRVQKNDADRRCSSKSPVPARNLEQKHGYPRKTIIHDEKSFSKRALAKNNDASRMRHHLRRIAHKIDQWCGCLVLTTGHKGRLEVPRSDRTNLGAAVQNQL
jgi:hypothetical protein